MRIPLYISTWAWIAMYRRFKKLVFWREPEIVGQCLRCGRCCRDIVLHVGGRWLRSEQQFKREKDKDPDLERFVIKSLDEDGRIIFGCSWLNQDGLCRDYENRLELCRDHPSLGLYYSGVVLSGYCGYKLKGPGFYDFAQRLLGRKPVSFAQVLEKERTGKAHPKKENS